VPVGELTPKRADGVRESGGGGLPINGKGGKEENPGVSYLFNRLGFTNAGKKNISRAVPRMRRRKKILQK